MPKIITIPTPASEQDRAILLAHRAATDLRPVDRWYPCSIPGGRDDVQACATARGKMMLRIPDQIRSVLTWAQLRYNTRGKWVDDGYTYRTAAESRQVLLNPSRRAEPRGHRPNPGSSAEIHLFDFDGTLFRSPPPPKGHKGGWWGRPDSLEPPHVPTRPGREWWNGHVVAAAHRSIANPNVLAIMATGRLARHFGWRVPELLGQAGLAFDHVHLCNGEDDTLPFKLDLLDTYLSKHAFVKTVHLWDDRKEHIVPLAGFVAASGRRAVQHHIESGLTMPADA